ncbi:unnamed protein product [Ectocarpus sp. 4 AP-2014]
MHGLWWSLQASPLLESPMLDTTATAEPTTSLWVEPEKELPPDELPFCLTARPPAIFSQARTESTCAYDLARGEAPPLARFGDGGQCLPSDGRVCPAVSWETMIAEPGPEDQDVTPLLSFRKDGSMVAAAAKTDLGLETCSLRPAAFTLGALCMADAKAPKVARASSQPQSGDDFVAAISRETAGEVALRTSPPAPPLTLESTITVDTGSPKTVLRLAPPAQHGPKTASPALPFCPRALPREVFTYAEKQARTCSSPPAPKALSAVVPAHANGGPPTRAMLPFFALSVPDVCKDKEESQTAEAITSTTSSASSAVDRSTAIVALTDREPVGPPPSAPSEEDEDDKPSAEQSFTDVCPVPADVRGDWWRCSAAVAHPKGAEAGEGTTPSLPQRSAVNDDDGHDTCQVPASLKSLLLLEYGAASSWRQEDEICLRSPEDEGDETNEEGDSVAGRYGKNVEDGGDMGGDGGRSEEAASCEALTALEVLEAEGFLPHKVTCPAELPVDKVQLDTPTTRALATMPTTSCLPTAVEDLLPRPAGQVCHAEEDEQATGDDGNRGDFDANSDDDDHRGENEDACSTGLKTLVREFNAWTRTVDFPIRKVEAGLIGNGMRLGLVATEAIPQGQSYLSVPRSIILDASKARTDPKLGPPLARLEASLGPLGSWDQDIDSLRVLLIAETFVRADLSPWAPYLRLLPTPSEMEAYHPLFFDNATIASFEGSDVQAPLRERRNSEVAGFMTKFVSEGSAGRELQDVLGVGWITLERYLWATAIVDSRCIWWGGRKHLVPLLDLVNNARDTPLAFIHETLQDSDGSAVTAAARNFDKGDQVLEDYGHPNHVLIFEHGFSLGRENRHDCVRIDAQRPPRHGADYRETLGRVLEAFPMGRPMFCISLRSNGPFDFVPYVRIIAGLPAVADEERLSPNDDDRGSCSSSVGFASTDADHGEESHFPFVPVTRVDYDEEPRARSSNPEEMWSGRAPSDGGSGVHERWQSLSNDAEGLRAVVQALKLRLSGYPTAVPLDLADDGGKVMIGDGIGGDPEESDRSTASDDSHGKVPSCTTEVFLDSEKHLLGELHDYLAGFLPPAVDVLAVPHGGVTQKNDSRSDGRTPNIKSSAETGTGEHGCVSRKGDADACGEGTDDGNAGHGQADLASNS